MCRTPATHTKISDYMDICKMEGKNHGREADKNHRVCSTSGGDAPGTDSLRFVQL